MSTLARYAHLDVGEDGHVRIERTRYKVIHLAGEHYHYGWSAEEILRQHPDLRPEQVHAALNYFHDNRDRLVAELHEVAALAEREAAAQPLSLAAILSRRAIRGTSRQTEHGMQI